MRASAVQCVSDASHTEQATCIHLLYHYVVEMAPHPLCCMRSTFPPLHTQKFHSSFVKLNCHETFLAGVVRSCASHTLLGMRSLSYLTSLLVTTSHGFYPGADPSAMTVERNARRKSQSCGLRIVAQNAVCASVKAEST